MRRLRVCFFVPLLALSACGGGTASSGGSSSGSRAEGTGPEGCTGHDPSREALCLSEGCRWGASLVCNGTEIPEDSVGPRACDCICADDEEACRSVPAAPPEG